MLYVSWRDANDFSTIGCFFMTADVSQQKSIGLEKDQLQVTQLQSLKHVIFAIVPVMLLKAEEYLSIIQWVEQTSISSHVLLNCLTVPLFYSLQTEDTLRYSPEKCSALESNSSVLCLTQASSMCCRGTKYIPLLFLTIQYVQIIFHTHFLNNFYEKRNATVCPSR